jgi:hypothetical protein
VIAYPSRSSEGDIEVYVRGSVDDATATARQLRRQWQKLVADTHRWLREHPGGEATIVPWRVRQVANVVVLYPLTVRREAARVDAAVVLLLGHVTTGRAG